MADVIAAGCDAMHWTAWDADENISPSFLVRARKEIGDAGVTLTWGGGNSITRALDGSDADDSVLLSPRPISLAAVRRGLCSSKGASEGLIQEVERVIFEAHSED